MTNIKRHGIAEINAQALDPSEEVLEIVRIEQGEDKRFYLVPNGAIDLAYGVYDYEFETWVEPPFFSQGNAAILLKEWTKTA